MHSDEIRKSLIDIATQFIAEGEVSKARSALSAIPEDRLTIIEVNRTRKVTPDSI